MDKHEAEETALANAIAEEVYKKAPEFCKGCDYLSPDIEDNRFDAPPRYPGDCTVYGQVTASPWCDEINGPSPEFSLHCPIVKSLFFDMKLDIECAFCQNLEVIRDKDNDLQIICEIHNCERYHKFEEWEDGLANKCS